MIDLLIYDTLPGSLMKAFEHRFMSTKTNCHVFLFEAYSDLITEHQLNDFETLTFLKLLSDNRCVYSSILLGILLSPVTQKRLTIKSHRLSFEALRRAARLLADNCSTLITHASQDSDTVPRCPQNGLSALFALRADVYARD